VLPQTGVTGDEGGGGEIEEAAGETPNEVALGQHPWHGARDASLEGSILQFNKVFGNGRWTERLRRREEIIAGRNV
jgi:hypothetical protein